jgi:predicted ABC-class ATPase
MRAVQVGVLSFVGGKLFLDDLPGVSSRGGSGEIGRADEHERPWLDGTLDSQARRDHGAEARSDEMRGLDPQPPHEFSDISREPGQRQAPTGIAASSMCSEVGGYDVEGAAQGIEDGKPTLAGSEVLVEEDNRRARPSSTVVQAYVAEITERHLPLLADRARPEPASRTTILTAERSGGGIGVRDVSALRTILRRIDRRGYKAYEELRGFFRLGDIILAIDHVQGDPYAPPSRVRVIVERSRLVFPPLTNRIRRVALEDFLARRARRAIDRLGRRRTGTGRSGIIQVDAGGQEVLERTACRISDDRVELRLSVGLPAAGRTVLGDVAEDLLTAALPEIARYALWLDRTALQEAERFIAVVEDAEALREQLPRAGLVAFIGRGAILPRRSGVSQEPLTDGVVPFEPPPSLEVELATPHSGRLRGMGIPEGVTLIVGGGFHGKSTLLEALARGVYNHIPGDGRERVVTRADAVVIRAEDGRRVVGVDLSPFIRDLPLGRSTTCFTSEDASGSTSQASNILEALEAGARVLLMDEDTCATNFMIRDHLMRELVPAEAEPIVPFIDRVRQLHREAGVSTILVMGGAGDYLHVADTVIWMHAYHPRDVTARAHELARQHGNGVFAPPNPWPGVVQRVPIPESIDPRRRERTRIKAHGTEEVTFGYESIDLRHVEQLVDPSQVRAIGLALAYAVEHDIIDGKRALSAILDLVDEVVDREGLDILSPYRGHPGDLARPRRYELAAALNRLRSLEVRQVRLAP